MKRILSEFRLYFCNRWISGLPSHTLRLWYYRTIMKFNIGKGSYIMMDCTFDRTEKFWMGNDSVINANCRMDTRGGIAIGENVSISSDVIILTADHDMDRADMKARTKKVVIEDYAWIGTRATILPGVTIGRGAVVAAGALVTKDVNPLQVVGGVPAKVIRSRSDGFDYSASYKRLFQ